MRCFTAVLGICTALLGTPALAQAPEGDPLSWLSRIAVASQRLNYVGTFTYQSGQQMETSRIAHKVDASGEYERLEVLDGSPREVVRSGGEVRCVLPEQKIIIIDQPVGRRAFPARIPGASPSFAGLADRYRIRTGEMGRVAGLEAQAIVLEPKDDLRYGYVLWAEAQSGLLLKSKMLDEKGEVVEQISFSEVKIGGEIERRLLKSSYPKAEGWKVVNARGSEVAKSESGWAVRAALPGFALISVVMRPLGNEHDKTVHMVYGDGMASISLFIEPAGAGEEAQGNEISASGAINIYRRMAGGHRITALGEVPLKALRQLADGVEPSS
ncbi:siderophore-interacting protein [Azoarcus sp. TTM-91]|uniref:MucB/RseB C-terminal domain-containing protein n=1 Tax=Azoarcus sp. TTM-91 TaxID=2691581 RepID=UPI00145DCC5F|nr:MucB/RseB C-terminal domain-containing protein [Azoarcus sp. TTM-91]NMG34069.1 siderophore-interacting protein [Azoarcus sp. TTM-91]